MAAAIISFAVGFGGWAIVSGISGRREAWDSPIYFSQFFPLLFVLSAVLGFLAPRHPWRWGLWMAAGQVAMMFVLQPAIGNLLPMGLILFGILGGICGVPALIASRYRVRLEGGKDSEPR